jgi:biotin carboxyl carrier protein
VRYEVVVGGRTIRIDRGLDGRFLVDDRVLALDLYEAPAGHWSVRLDGRAHEIVVLSQDPLRLVVDGHEISAAVIDERALAGGRAGAGAPGARSEIRAPMPGLLKAVHVREGDVVESGAALVTLEAMKMENELRSPGAARVARIAAAPGSKVEGGALLVVLVAP